MEGDSATMIDVHGHILPHPESLDELIASGAVEKAWLLALPALADPSYAGDVHFGGNDDVLAAAQRYPDFFLPFGYLDFRQPPEHIVRLHDMGFVGLKAIFTATPYDDPSYMPYYELAAAHRMPIMFHLGGLGAVREQDLGPGLSTRSVNMRPCHLGTIAGNFPDLICVGAHLGQAWHAEVLEGMRCYPNLYFDISGGDRVLIMRWLLQNLGEPAVVDHLLGGLDIVYGAPPYHDSIREAATFWDAFFKYTGQWFDRDDHAQRILRDNAKTIHATMSLNKESLSS